MGILKNLLSGMGKGKAEFKEKFKQAQEEDKIMNILEERKKSANRRELERYYRDKEEEKIKEALNKIHKKGNQENWKSKNMVLAKGKNILANDKPMLKEKHIFQGNKNIFTKEYAIKNNTNMGFFK